MRRMLFSVQAWGLFCLLIGCGSTGLYNQQSWVPPETEKATADWDVASGICDKLALDKKLTAKEKAQIESEREELMELANFTSVMGEQVTSAASQVGNQLGGNLGLAAQGAGAVLGVMSSFSGATAEEDKKEETFLKCMEALDWKRK